jgi:phosphocarrier protein FPr
VASDLAAVPVLIGLGVDELSVAPYAVPLVKQRIRELETNACAALARQALDLASAADVRTLVGRSSSRHRR